MQNKEQVRPPALVLLRKSRVIGLSCFGMSNMQSLPLTDGPVRFAGAVDLDITSDGVQPWRLPLADHDLYEPTLRGRLVGPAGVRLTWVSDTSTVKASFTSPAYETQLERGNWTFDLLVDGKLHDRVSGDRETDKSLDVTFSSLPDGEHLLELYLDMMHPVQVTKLEIDAGATAKPWEDDRPKWVVYGSSITHCGAAAGPSETWPAIVANTLGLNLTCLGVGGNCHADPMMGRLIRDLPADYISMCLGINIMGGATLNGRTLRAAVIGLIKTIRDRHTDAPMVVVSPISNPPREETPNAVEMTLVRIRDLVEDGVQVIQAAGDENLFYQDGLELFGPDLVHHMPDQLHPDAEGYRVLAQRYADIVMPKLGLGAVAKS